LEKNKGRTSHKWGLRTIKKKRFAKKTPTQWNAELYAVVKNNSLEKNSGKSEGIKQRGVVLNSRESTHQEWPGPGYVHIEYSREMQERNGMG